jgi:hypothetical protein
MSTYERSIVSIIEPSFKKSPSDKGGKLLLDEIFVEDSESKESEEKYQGNLRKLDTKMSSRAGSVFPIVAINSLIMGDDEINDLEIDMSGKIPRLMMNFSDNSNHFAISSPIDGDVISVYIRPADADNQKPIRIDFIIQSILSEPKNKVYFISGIMKIPKFYTETYKSFPNNTSFEHLGDICEELGLGFASNEESTDDSMTRIIPSDSYETFIDDTVGSAYKDDDSFFDWYIDPYYYLCFVNLNKQFSLEDKTEPINISDSFPTSGRMGASENQDPDQQKGSLVLTNLTSMAGKNVYIENYSLDNSAGNIWMDNGYKRYAQWMEIEESSIEFQEAFVDPLTTKGSENDYILLKGRRSDGPPNFPKPLYLDESKYKWMGKQAGVLGGGNVHDNYCFAQVLNHQNIQETKKTRLVVDVEGMNHYIYKYMRIPVIIYESSVNQSASEIQSRDEALGETGEPQKPEEGKGMFAGAGGREDSPGPKRENNNPPELQDQVKNEFLSGYYVVADIKYTYYPGEGIKQRLSLIRREWPIPAKQAQQG